VARAASAHSEAATDEPVAEDCKLAVCVWTIIYQVEVDWIPRAAGEETRGGFISNMQTE
jgi:hypothetical protein